jgi:hypothetical protein
MNARVRAINAGGAELHRFVVHIDAALVPQVFDSPERQREGNVDHHRQADDPGARLEPLEGAGFGQSAKPASGLHRLNPSLSDSAMPSIRTATEGASNEWRVARISPGLAVQI